MPLSVICDQRAIAIGRPLPAGRGPVLDGLRHLREANLSVFRGQRRRFHPRPIPQPLAWDAESGTLGAGLRVVPDGEATAAAAVEVADGLGGPGAATYRIDVPVAGSYLLCCRLWARAAGSPLAVRVDDGPRLGSPLPPGPSHAPLVVPEPLELGAGRHALTVLLPPHPHPGTRLDLLELTPRPGRLASAPRREAR